MIYNWLEHSDACWFESFYLHTVGGVLCSEVRAAPCIAPPLSPAVIEQFKANPGRSLRPMPILARSKRT